MTERTDYWWNTCALRTYSDALSFFNRAKNKDKGKPLCTWARIFREGDTLDFYYGDKTNGVKFAELTPDNIFTFVASPHDLRNLCAVTFSSSLYRAVPFMWQRVALGRYRIQHTSHIPYSKDYMDWGYMRTKAIHYEKGLRFNMLTGECLNSPPEYTEQVNEVNRKEWLRSLRKFKYAMKVRGRIGAFDPIIQSIKSDSNAMAHKGIPDWSDPLWLNALTESIKTGEINMEVMRGFVAHALFDRWYYHRGSIKSENVLDTVNSVCTTFSFDLRKKFGVFNAVSPMQEKAEVSRHKVARHGETNHTEMEV